MWQTQKLVAFHKSGDLSKAPVDWIARAQGVGRVEARASGALVITVIVECADDLMDTLRQRGWTVSPSRTYSI